MKRSLLFQFILLLLLAIACKKTPEPGIAEPIIPPTVPVAGAGLISTSVDFPTSDASFTVTFDPSKGNAELNAFSGDVYIYTGVITPESKSQTDWRYVKSTSFNAPDPAAKMTSTGTGKYQITISPRSFFGVPAGEKILKVVMLFRTADGSKVARNKDKSDIYLPVYETGALAVKFTAPALEPTYVPTPEISIKMVGEQLSVAASSSKNANLSLSLNGTTFASASNATQVSGTAKVASAGSQLVKITATEGGNTAESTFSFVISGTVETAELPSGAKEGVVFTNGGTSAIITLFAPNKQNVYLLGDFNDWQPESKYFMKRTSDGNKWWVQIDGLTASKEYAYQFLVDGKLKVADPYSEKVLDPSNDSFISPNTYPSLMTYPNGKTTGIVSVMQGNKPNYAWKVNTFKRPEKNKLVIYELHLRDFLGAHNYTTLTDTLNYLSRLGINAIELMPVNEFEGNSSWGYNPSFYFAADKYYGTNQALQRLIDECHTRGIAVIMDMVLNHSFGQSPMVQLYFDETTSKPSSGSPWFNADPTHPFNVGYDMNHESPATKTFVKNVIKFWMEEYKVDGFRFDLSKGFTQKNSGTNDAAVGPWGAYDASRVAIWKNYNSYIKSLDSNNFYVILEHFAADQEEKELAAQGMMFWNNVNYNFTEATMGFLSNSNFSRAFYSTHGFTDPDNLITYMESHDEERMMFKNLSFGNTSGSYSVKNLATALKRQEMAAAFLFSIPGPKMIWQFGELGYDVSIDNNGRTGEKAIRWDYYSTPARKALYDIYAKMIKMKTSNSIFDTKTATYSLVGGVKYIKLENADNTLIVVGNFDVTGQTANVDFGSSGVWYHGLGGADITLTGATYTTPLAAGEYHIYSRKRLN